MKYGITEKRRCNNTLAKINFYGKKEGGCVDGFFSFLIAFSLILYPVVSNYINQVLVF